VSDETMSMLDDRIAELEDENAALQRENAALRKDKERMDWLVKNHQYFMSKYTTNDSKMFRSYIDTCISMWDKFERKG
jgi:hypothetical protein